MSEHVEAEVTRRRRRGMPEDFKEEMLRLLERPPIPVELEPLAAWQIMAALQLATRHPGMSESIRHTCETLARELQDRIATSPALARVAERGWHQEFDEDVT